MKGINPITGLSLQEECELLMSHPELLNNLRIIKFKEIKRDEIIKDILNSPLNVNENGNLRFQKIGLENKSIDVLCNLAVTEFQFNLNKYSKVKCVNCYFIPANTQRLNTEFGNTFHSDLIEIKLNNGKIQSYDMGQFHDYGNTNFIEIYKEFFSKGKIDFSSIKLGVNKGANELIAETKNSLPIVANEKNDEEFISHEVEVIESKDILLDIPETQENIFDGDNNLLKEKKLEDVNKKEEQKIELEEVDDFSQEEIIEQDNYAKQYEGLERDEIIKSLREDEEQVLITKNIVGYKRNPKRIGAIKELGKFQCQICQNFILKKNGGRYIEAAHIKAKHLKGQETIQNILLLCPNHHKEFDFGDLEIINWDDSSITFILNEIEHTITFIIE